MFGRSFDHNADMALLVARTASGGAVDNLLEEQKEPCRSPEERWQAAQLMVALRTRLRMSNMLE